MTHAFIAAAPADIDKSTASWRRVKRETFMPPVAADVAGKLYLVSEGTGDEYLIKKAAAIREALDISIAMHGAVTLAELAAIAQLAERLGIDPATLPIFAEKGIKGAKSFETLKKAASLPEPILQFIDERPLPLKTLALLISLDADAVAFIAAFIETKHPSAQALKIFIESTADFRDDLKNSGYDRNFIFPDRRSAVHKEIDTAFDTLVKKAAPLKISQPDNFETGRLVFSFDMASYDNYAVAAEKISSIKDDIAEFCILMKKYDIY